MTDPCRSHQRQLAVGPRYKHRWRAIGVQWKHIRCIETMAAFWTHKIADYAHELRLTVWTWFPHSARDHLSGGMRKPCPNCQAEFVSIVCNFVCPKCGHRFDASDVFPLNAYGSPPMFVTWSNGQLPLMTAARVGHLEIFTLLL